MKKMLCLMLAIVILIIATACGNQKNTPALPNSNTSNTVANTKPNLDDINPSEPTVENKIVKTKLTDTIMGTKSSAYQVKEENLYSFQTFVECKSKGQNEYINYYGHTYRNIAETVLIFDLRESNSEFLISCEIVDDEENDNKYYKMDIQYDKYNSFTIECEYDEFAILTIDDSGKQYYVGSFGYSLMDVADMNVDEEKPSDKFYYNGESIQFNERTIPTHKIACEENLSSWLNLSPCELSDFYKDLYKNARAYRNDVGTILIIDVRTEESNIELTGKIGQDKYGENAFDFLLTYGDSDMNLLLSSGDAVLVMIQDGMCLSYSVTLTSDYMLKFPIK